MAQRCLNKRFCVFGVLLLGAIPSCTAAATTGADPITTAPIPTSNRIPFIAIHGLPPARSALLLEAG
ncbi:MAG: hypothetical protein ABR612_13750, partial [Chromatocurvus sp.]